MRATIDSDLLVYVVDARDPIKHRVAGELLTTLATKDCWIGLQAIGEAYWAQLRRLRLPSQDAAKLPRHALSAFKTFGYSAMAVERALAEAVAGRFSYWDALLLAAADEAGCRFCISEDMRDGATLGNVEIVHPFGPKGVSERMQRTLAALIA